MLAQLKCLWVIQLSLSKQTPLTIIEKENLWDYGIGTVSGKTICHWGFKPRSRVHQPHTCRNRCLYEQISTSCLARNYLRACIRLNTHDSHQNACTKLLHSQTFPQGTSTDLSSTIMNPQEYVPGTCHGE
jgi:hypothetical protein